MNSHSEVCREWMHAQSMCNVWIISVGLAIGPTVAHVARSEASVLRILQQKFTITVYTRFYCILIGIAVMQERSVSCWGGLNWGWSDVPVGPFTVLALYTSSAPVCRHSVAAPSPPLNSSNSLLPQSWFRDLLHFYARPRENFITIADSCELCYL